MKKSKKTFKLGRQKSEKTKILFINPPQSVSIETKYPNFKFPLGFLYMAGVLEKNQFEVKILDCPLYTSYKEVLGKERARFGLPLRKILEIIKEYTPDIIGVSCAYSMYESDSFDVIKAIRANFKNAFIVVGGAHTSANPEFVLRNKDINLAVIGEGEETILEIAKNYRAGKDLKNIKGTALKIKNTIKINKPREYIQDLDSLKPAWHLLDMNQYFAHPDNSTATMRKNSIDLITSRGCPARCAFCSIHTVWGRKWRGRSAKNVVDEIEFLHKKYNSQQFRFQDDNLTLDKKRIIEICNEITKRKLNIKWDTPNGVALWSIDKEIISKMKEAGCYRITFGIESACRNSQKYIGKVLNLEYISGMISFCHKVGLWVCSTFIIGFPCEKKEEIKETEHFILTAGINFPFIYIAQPYQGTKMYEDFKKLNLIDHSFLQTSNLTKTKYNTMYLKNEELNVMRNEIYKKFYIQQAIAYLNPAKFHREFLSKIKNFEELNYAMNMFIKVFLNR